MLMDITDLMELMSVVIISLCQTPTLMIITLIRVLATQMAMDIIDHTITQLRAILQVGTPLIDQAIDHLGTTRQN